jgi:hypothetical protein
MKSEKKYIGCDALEKHRLGWAYTGLRHAQELVDAMDKWSVADEDFTENMIEKRLIGAAVSISILLNLLEPIHGFDACVAPEEGCVVIWTREFLDTHAIPDLNRY